MNTLTATVIGNYPNLENHATAINNGRTDGLYFYANNGTVSVSHPQCGLSEDVQRMELEWFLNGKKYEIN